MKRQITVCDCCEKPITNVCDGYSIDRVILQTGNFTDAAGSRDYNQIISELCPGCARRVADSLETLIRKKIRV
jgi:hypothetical protein